MVSESCKVQGQCLIPVGYRQEVLVLENALDKLGAPLVFEALVIDGRGSESSSH